jgi:hypothetical protein
MIEYYKNRNIPRIEKNETRIEIPIEDWEAVGDTIAEVEVVLTIVVVVAFFALILPEALTMRHPVLIKGPYLPRVC